MTHTDETTYKSKLKSNSVIGQLVERWKLEETRQQVCLQKVICESWLQLEYYRYYLSIYLFLYTLALAPTLPQIVRMNNKLRTEHTIQPIATYSSPTAPRLLEVPAIVSLLVSTNTLSPERKTLDVRWATMKQGTSAHLQLGYYQ